MIKSIPYPDKITDYKGVFRFIKTPLIEIQLKHSFIKGDDLFLFPFIKIGENSKLSLPFPVSPSLHHA